MPDKPNTSDRVHGYYPPTEIDAPISNQSKSLKDVQDWLTIEISKRLGIPVEEIDPTRSLDEYGLESIDALELSADLEDWLDRSINPRAFYDHPSIGDLAYYLMKKN